VTDLAWRTQIAMLWLLQVVNFVAIIFISYFGTGLIAAFTPEEVGPVLAAYFFAFALLISLAYLLKPAVGRWIHLVAGGLIALLKAAYVAQSLGGETAGAFQFNEVWGLVAAIWLVWVAWKGPAAGA
jgi:hypothetical protein